MASKAETWLAKTLGYEFNDARLLQQALTHRSCPGDNNERLEFLGDATLELVISEIVFRSHATAPEGDLSRLRAALVKDTSLAELAAELGVGDHLVLGGGERKSGGHRRKSILADALEAIFGAVYLDAGFDAARTVIERAFRGRLANMPSVEELRDPKTRLQEWLQARGRPLPEYLLAREEGADHAKQFFVRVRLPDDGSEAEESGRSRRKAEQAAAQSMLLALGHNS